jgi:serine/threonine protein kinase
LLGDVDPINRVDLDWQRRYKIIGSIAWGILYLHEDSRLCIIHRDLKASNILLDVEMNPKFQILEWQDYFRLIKLKEIQIELLELSKYPRREELMFTLCHRKNIQVLTKI